jgi:ubiquinone/menaquinone biosynthesis C-methylase UbiE
MEDSHPIKARFTAGWDLAAPGYGALNAHFVALGRRLAEQAPLFPGDQVLDVGCGTGAVALAAAPRVAPEGRVTGIDLSAAMLAQSRANAAAAGVTNVCLAQMDAETLAFPDESFSAALAGLALFFLPDLARGLAELRRVLRRGGRLAFTAFGRGFLEPLAGRLAADIKAHGLPPNPLVKQMSWDPADLRDRVEAAGFFLVQTALEDETVLLPDVEAWWGLLWHGAFRAFAYDLAPERLARFRAEHLAAVAAQAGPAGLAVRMPVITVQAVRA